MPFNDGSTGDKNEECADTGPYDKDSPDTSLNITTGTCQDVSPRILSVCLDMEDERQGVLETVDLRTVMPSIERTPNNAGKHSFCTSINFTDTGNDDTTLTPVSERALLSPRAAKTIVVEGNMAAGTENSHEISPPADEFAMVSDMKEVLTPVGKPRTILATDTPSQSTPNNFIGVALDKSFYAATGTGDIMTSTFVRAEAGHTRYP